jgi:hypothetical protein
MKQWLREHRFALFGWSGWAYAALSIFIVLWSSASGWLWVPPVLGTLWLIAVVWFVWWINGPESERIERETQHSRYDDPDRLYGAPW